MNVSVAGAVLDDREAESQVAGWPVEEVGAETARPVRLPPPEFVIVMDWGAGVAPPADAPIDTVAELTVRLGGGPTDRVTLMARGTTAGDAELIVTVAE